MSWLDSLLNYGCAVANADPTEIIERIRRQFLCHLSQLTGGNSAERKQIVPNLIKIINDDGGMVGRVLVPVVKTTKQVLAADPSQKAECDPTVAGAGGSGFGKP